MPLKGESGPTPKEMGVKPEKWTYGWEKQLQTRFDELFDKKFDNNLSEEERDEFGRLSKVMLLLERM